MFILLVIIIVLLLISLVFLDRTTDTNLPIEIDPAAQFLRDHTRDDITDAQTTAAGQFLVETAEPTSPEELQAIEEFFVQPRS